MSLPPFPRTLREWVKALLIVAVITLVGVLTLEPPWAGGAVGRIVWPAGGIAFAAVMMGGWRYWVTVPIAAALVTVFTGGASVHVIATVVGNTLETVIICALLKRYRFNSDLGRVRDVMLLVTATMIGASVSGTFGALGLHLSTSLSTRTLYRIWWFWALGHAMGIIVFAPPILLFRRGLELLRTTGRVAEAALVITGLLAVGPLALRSTPEAPLDYLPFPLLIWATTRFRQPGAAVSNVIIAGTALVWTAMDWGPFNRSSTTFSYLSAWCYANVIAVSALIFAAVVNQAKEAESEIERRSEEYRKLIEQAPDGVLMFDAGNRCLNANPSAALLLRCQEEQLRGVSFSDLISDADTKRSADTVAGLERGASGVFSWRMLRFDGSQFPAEVSVRRFEDGRLQAFMRDVEEREELQEQILRSQKLRALGQLAGGLAHEFNNVLTVILSYSTIAKSTLLPSNRASKDIDNVINAAERASALTRQLLAFGRRQPVDPQIISINELLEDMSTILRRVMGANVQVVILPSAETWHVKVDSGQLQQVIFNLAINARDSMPEGGTLILECHNAVKTASKATNGADDLVCLRVTDTGAGIPADVLPRVFEPFFTTKKRAEGAGLGLAVSYAIIERAGGELQVRSELGKGTTFEISLPRTPEPAELAGADQADSQDGSPEPASQLTVLLIEDEDPLRGLLADLLTRKGFHVLTAGDGEEAVELAAGVAGPLDLIVSDVMLPGISGPEAVKAIRRGGRPDLKALYVSGYAEDRIAPDELQSHLAAFLSKPFKPAELVMAVHAIMSDRVAERPLT